MGSCPAPLIKLSPSLLTMAVSIRSFASRLEDGLCCGSGPRPAQPGARGWAKTLGSLPERAGSSPRGTGEGAFAPELFSGTLGWVRTGSLCCFLPSFRSSCEFSPSGVVGAAATAACWPPGCRIGALTGERAGWAMRCALPVACSFPLLAPSSSPGTPVAAPPGWAGLLLWDFSL